MSCLISCDAIIKELYYNPIVRVCSLFISNSLRYLYKNMGSAQISKMLEHEIVNILLFSSLNICFGYSKKLSHRDSSFEYPKHMF